MTSARFVQMAGLLAVTAILSSVVTAGAQTAQAPSALKTIGATAAAAKPEIVPSLFVLNSRAATLQGRDAGADRRCPELHHICRPPGAIQPAISPPPTSSRSGIGRRQLARNPPNATLVRSSARMGGEGRSWC